MEFSWERGCVTMESAKGIFEKIIKDGEVAIDEFIITRKSEELFLDFKRSADNGSGTRLHQTDKENLAKAISGFGNSEGGVVVWGIDCSIDEDYADVARTKFPIQNVKRFVSWLEDAISRCTVPPHVGVQHHYVITGEQDIGFVITYIPKSNHAPHQVVGKLRYYIRAGSSFIPTPHAVLAGMFGRRPQPSVFNMFTMLPAEPRNEKIEVQIGFLIKNIGPGIASDLFMNAMVISIPGDNCKLAFKPSDPNNWTGYFSFGRHVSMISKTHVRLPPEAHVQPFFVDLELAPPFTRELIIDGICGCGQSPSVKFRIENDSTTIQRLYNDFLRRNGESLLTKEDKHAFVKDLLNIKNEEES